MGEAGSRAEGRVAPAGASRPAAAPERLPGGSEERGHQCRLSGRRRNGTRGGGGTAAPAGPARAAPSAGAAPPVPAPSLAPTPAALACPVPMRPGRGLRRARWRLRHSAAEVPPGEDVGWVALCLFAPGSVLYRHAARPPSLRCVPRLTGRPGPARCDPARPALYLSVGVFLLCGPARGSDSSGERAVLCPARRQDASAGLALRAGVSFRV